MHAYDKLVTTPAVVPWLRWVPFLGYLMVVSQVFMLLGNVARGNVNLGTPFDVLINLGMAALLMLPFDASPYAGAAKADVPEDPRLARPGLFRLLTRQRVGLASMAVFSLATLGLYPAIWVVRRHADVEALGEPAPPAWLAALPLGLGLLRVAATIAGVMLLSVSRSQVAFALLAVCVLWFLEAGALAWVGARWARTLAPHVGATSAWQRALAPTYVLERALDRLRVRPVGGKLDVVPHGTRFQPVALLAIGTLALSGLLAVGTSNAIKVELQEAAELDAVLDRLHERHPAGAPERIALAEKLLDSDPGGEGVLAAAHRLSGDLPKDAGLRARANLVNAKVRLYGGLVGPHEVRALELGSAGMSVLAALQADERNVRCWVLKAWIAHFQGSSKDLAASIKRARALGPLDEKLKALEQHLAAEAGGKLQPIGISPFPSVIGGVL